MLITDLDHLNSISEAKEVEGGLSTAIVTFETLALGNFNTVSLVNVEVLSVDSNGVSIAGAQGTIAVSAE